MTDVDLIAAARDLALRLQQLVDQDPDPNTVPGLSHNEREARIEDRYHLDRHLRTVHGFRAAYEDLIGRRADRLARRTKVAEADAAVAAKLEAAPDHRSVGGMAGNREWQRQDMLRDARRSLWNGALFYDGLPAVPAEVLELLGGNWLGSLNGLDEEIANLDKRVAESRSSLESVLWGVEAYLRDVDGRRQETREFRALAAH